VICRDKHPSDRSLSLKLSTTVHNPVLEHEGAGDDTKGNEQSAREASADNAARGKGRAGRGGCGWTRRAGGTGGRSTSSGSEASGRRQGLGPVKRRRSAQLGWERGKRGGK
jgi:hypothetical protein